MPIPPSCPVCSHPDAVTRTGDSSREYICDCPRCLTYGTTHEFLLFAQDETYAGRKHLLSGLLREMTELGETPLVLYKNLEEVLGDSRIPDDSDIDAKQDKILRSLRRQSPSLGSPIALDLETHRSIGYARDMREFHALLKELERSSFIEMHITDVDVDETANRVVNSVEVTLTGEGWKRGEPFGGLTFV